MTGIGIAEDDLRLLIDILNNLSIKGKDTAIQIVRIIMALESALPQEEDTNILIPVVRVGKSWVYQIKQVAIRKNMSMTSPTGRFIQSIVFPMTDLMVLGQTELKHGSVAIAVLPIA